MPYQCLQLVLQIPFEVFAGLGQEEDQHSRYHNQKANMDIGQRAKRNGSQPVRRIHGYFGRKPDSLHTSGYGLDSCLRLVRIMSEGHVVMLKVAMAQF